MSSKKFKPLGNRILVKRSSAEKSRGGILLPESAKEKPKMGRSSRQRPWKNAGKWQRERD